MEGNDGRETMDLKRWAGEEGSETISGRGGT